MKICEGCGTSFETNGRQYRLCATCRINKKREKGGQGTGVRPDLRKWEPGLPPRVSLDEMARRAHKANMTYGKYTALYGNM